MKYDSILLVGFGGPMKGDACRCTPPSCPGAAWCFVRGILEAAMPGRPPDRERIALVVSHYELLGGYSPYNEHTFAQAGALRAALEERGVNIPLFVGMKSWTPRLADVLGEMHGAGRRRALAVILSPHQGAASWGRYEKAIAGIRKDMGPAAPGVEFLEGWWNASGFIEALAARARKALEEVPELECGAAALAFTNHSVPVSMAGERDPYVRQFEETARLAARALGREEYSLVYQSAPLPARTPWLGPDIGEWIQKLPASTRHAVAVPAGFLCDHMEVLYDLDVQAREAARTRGISFHRAPTVGTHPAFIRMLAERIADALR
jgi:ferrochelatase